MSAFHLTDASGSGPDRARVVSLDSLKVRARRHQTHALHRGERIWHDTDSHVDLWIELLHGYAFEPRAALAFTVTQDFEDDQFTLPRVPLDDIDKLFGLQVQELSIFDSLEERVLTQTRRANTVLIEVDAFHLPDTRSIAYHRAHVKTTIAVDTIDPDARRLGYFHNTGYYVLAGDDYDHLLHRLDAEGAANALYPHVEFVKQAREALTGTALAEACADTLCAHLLRRPEGNPVGRWRAAFPGHVETMLERGEPYAQQYSSNVMRQLGSNFEFLAHYLGWMRKQGFDIPHEARLSAQKIASEAMVLQCKLARALSRQRCDHCEASFDVLERAYERTVPVLAAIVC
ncbi:DUF1839 family protein [Caballeronia telluris]|uniref:DUF1839 domain-containing protein n=1 Tax=Caballeronia telluris TaxID=326475 RepID=A0A158JJJ6_9BURK|nr:DUF1839 family protein [Caballeronia telluris]SAL69057.1 hypothetical protein AWB66_04309 [Caballeronia telluris]